MNKTYLVGDLHGEVKPIKDWYNSGDHKGDTLICLGDFGMNYFMNYRDAKSKEALAKLDLNIIALRGNHEDRAVNCLMRRPQEWSWTTQLGTVKDGIIYYELAYPNIGYLADDVGLYTIENYQVLTLPGAYSPDKQYRIAKKWSWFPDEMLTPDEMAEGLRNYGGARYNFIFSHTCPHSWEIYFRDLFMPSIDQSKIDKSMERWMDTLLANGTRYDRWYFGHFHDNRDLPMNATMLFQDFILLGESIHSYQAKTLLGEI